MDLRGQPFYTPGSHRVNESAWAKQEDAPVAGRRQLAGVSADVIPHPASPELIGTHVLFGEWWKVVRYLLITRDTKVRLSRSRTAPSAAANA